MPWAAAISAASAIGAAYQQQGRHLSASHVRDMNDIANGLAAAQYAQAYNAAQQASGVFDALHGTRVDVLYGLETLRPSYYRLDMREPAAKPEPAARPKTTADEARKFRAMLFPRWTFHSPFRRLELWLYRLLRRYAR